MNDTGLKTKLINLQKALPERISIAGLLEQLGFWEYPFFMMLFSIPSALPIPALGYGTLFGAILLILSIQMLFKRTTPWIPRYFALKTISRKSLDPILGKAIHYLEKLEKLFRPRMAFYGKSKQIYRLVGLSCFLLACIMIVPLPLTNTAPAMLIFALNFSLIQKDGLLGIVFLAVSYCVIAFYLVAFTLAYLGITNVLGH